MTHTHLLTPSSDPLRRIVDSDTALRAGNGLLPANPDDEPANRCSECKSPEPEGTVVDDGIGHYDGMGGGFDTRLRWASVCCEADIISANGQIVERPEREPVF